MVDLQPCWTTENVDCQLLNNYNMFNVKQNVQHLF